MRFILKLTTNTVKNTKLFPSYLLFCKMLIKPKHGLYF